MLVTVNASDGPAPAYVYTGGKAFDPALPCVVFVHGALNDHSVWTLLARWFAHHGHAVLAVDLPGHGRSGGAPVPSVEAGMGSLVALEAAARAPARASRLAMVGTAYPMKVSAALLETARDQPLRAIDMVNVFSHSGIAAKPSYPGPGTWLQGASRALMRRTQAGQRGLNLFHHDFGVCDRYAGGLEAAAKVQCPATLVLGERDQMTGPTQAGAIARALRAQVVMLPAGHALMSEAPDGLLAALRAALVDPAIA